MNSPSKLLTVLALSAMAATAAEPPSVQTLRLDDRVVVTVPVATNRVTTISFPGPIAAIDAAGVSADPKNQGQFQLAHTPGSAFVSVRAATRKGTTNLNIRWNQRTYVFELVESDHPVLALNLERTPPLSTEPLPPLSPLRLLSLLDKAKAFPLLKAQHPESLGPVESRTFAEKPQITDVGDYEIQTQELFRFQREDTLVFHVLLRNKTDREFRYRPDSFVIRAGNRLYNQSISDATGTVFPHGEATIYFAVTGTPDGGRNELSLKNDFSVLVTRITPPPDPQASTNAVSTPTRP